MRWPEKTSTARVAIVGGGLAGLAAAVAASQCGLNVELFESRGRLGGRAGSFRDPASGELVDHCQHVAMGCCTNWADFCRRTAIADCFRRQRRLWFIGPDGVARQFAASAMLPSPLHLASGLMRLDYLTVRERLGIARALVRMARRRGETDCTVGEWLRQQGQSRAAIELFWATILVSALGETLDRASLAAARKVFVDGFLRSRRAYELELPAVPLGEIYDRRLGRWLAEQGVGVRLQTRVRRIEGDGSGATSLVLADGEVRSFDFVIVAVPWGRAATVLSDELRRAMPALEGIAAIEPSPITAVHLWFDRPIMRLPHAVLVGRLSQWVFRRSDGKAVATDHMTGQTQQDESEAYYQVVISASHDLDARSREEVVGKVCRELAAVWPAAEAAHLARWRMVTNPAAVFSVGPDLERHRPAQQTEVPNLMLAGDWTATGWPATMEGAVRSGYLAVEAILRRFGDRRRIVVADLPRGWLARWMLGND